jgi:hypothetical protein
MKKFIDFESKGPVAKALDVIIGIPSADCPEDADLILTDSVDKTLEYLQRTEKKVVQVCIQGPALSHLVEDYPNRFRTVNLVDAVLDTKRNNLLEIVNSIASITKQS